MLSSVTNSAANRRAHIGIWLALAWITACSSDEGPPVRANGGSMGLPAAGASGASAGSTFAGVAGMAGTAGASAGSTSAGAAGALGGGGSTSAAGAAFGGGGTTAGGASGGGSAGKLQGGASGLGGSSQSGGSGGAAAGAPAGGTGGASGGSATGCPPTALFCEDFEDGNLDGWTKVLTSGTLDIASDQAAHGRSALAVNIPANQRGGFIEKRGAPLFPLPAKAMWGRLMIRFDGVSDGHTDFVRGATASGGTPWYNVGEQHGEILLNYYNGSAADCWARPMPGKLVAENAWTCWEWRFDGGTNEMEFFIDGQLSRKVTGTGDGCLSNAKTTWTAPDFGSLRIGAYIAETRATVMRVWIDDVAVGTQGRIGCPAP